MGHHLPNSVECPRKKKKTCKCEDKATDDQGGYIELRNYWILKYNKYIYASLRLLYIDTLALLKSYILIPKSSISIIYIIFE